MDWAAVWAPTSPTLLSDRYGAGIFVRYVAASLKLPTASSVKAGGVQAAS
jgi:hypothetical protein